MTTSHLENVMKVGNDSGIVARDSKGVATNQ